VLAARGIEAQAVAAAARARETAARADDAAQRARRQNVGFRTEHTENDRYDGAWSIDGPHGVGVLIFTGGNFIADRYRGEFVDGHYNGYGVYHWAENANNGPEQLHFEGQFANDAGNGLGVRTYRSGETRTGEVRNWLTTGYVVQRMTDGRRYEGQMDAGDWHGYGVIWAPDGTVAAAGYWQRDELVSPMAQGRAL
jgi:hypothetical protein